MDTVTAEVDTATAEVDTVAAGPYAVKRSPTRSHAACHRMQHGQLVRDSLATVTPYERSLL